MSLSSIDLGIRELLNDPTRRHEFFKAITQDDIASQIRALRKKRELTQAKFARKADMKQSAVSRIEQAEYSRWSLTTLFRVAAALNARWRVILEPAEDAMREYEQPEDALPAGVTIEAESAQELFYKHLKLSNSSLEIRPARPAAHGGALRNFKMAEQELLP